MSLFVQVSGGDISSVSWYRGDEIEWDENLLWPFNQKGSYSGYMEIRPSSSPLYINFTPLNAVNLQGVILCLFAGSTNTNYNRDVIVELEESTDSGTSWAVVRNKTFHFPDDANAGQVEQYGRYFIDIRFDTSYALNTTYLYRFKIYRGSASPGTLYLNFSSDSSYSSWTADVSDYAFRIIYSDTTGTPTSSDVLVVTDWLTIKQNWTVGYITIPTSPTKYYLDGYNNKPSIWIAAKGSLYIPSNISSDITVEIKGRMYISGGDRVAWQIGDDEANPIPSSRTVNWYFNCEGVNRRAGSFGFRCTWAKVEHYGSEVVNWYGVLKYDVSSGSNQIVVEGDVTNEWQIGDKLRIGGVKYSSTRHYADYQRDHTYYEISSLSYDAGNDETTITLTANLAYMREATGRILLIRRNVNIYGDKFSSVQNRVDHYINYGRWWRCCWVRYADSRYPIFQNGFNGKIPLSSYPHKDILKGVLLDNCFQAYLQYRKGGEAQKLSACDDKTSGWYWGEGNYTFHRCRNFNISDIVCLSQYYSFYLSQSSNIELSNFWLQARYPVYLYLTTGSQIHDGVIFNSRHLLQISGSSNNEFYDIEAKNIYYNSNESPSTLNVQGCFYYSSDMFSRDNYFHDITIENLFCLFFIDSGDGCSDWFDNIEYSNATVDISTVYRNDWLDDTKIRFTTKKGIENNDWIHYKYGSVHRTGNYQDSDDITYRSDGGCNYALRLEPQLTGEDFDSYSIRLTGCKANKPVYYLGYIYVSSNYFSGTDVDNPEIYLTGIGIDCSTELTAKWVHPGSAYADQWVSFVIIGTPTTDGEASVVFKTKSDGVNPYVYIDDDSYSWPESVDYRSHEVWINGEPASPPAIFPTITAADVWQQPVSSLHSSATIGRLLSEHSGIVLPNGHKCKVGVQQRIFFALESETSFVIKTNIYKEDGTVIVSEQAMTKIGSTRYYSYDWTPDTEGSYIIECFVENFVIRDSTLIDVLTASDWWATNNELLTHRNAVEPNIDVAISSRSSHTPADVWGYSDRELTHPDNYKADVSALALEATVQLVKSQTDKLSFTPNNEVKSSAQNSELSNLDASISSRATQSSVDSIASTLSTMVSDIWSYSTRTLTSFGSLISDIWNYSTRLLTGEVSLNNGDKDEIADKVWDESITDHTTSDTFGSKNQRLVPSEGINDYKADVSALAQEATAQAIKTKTDNLPSDPASTTNINNSQDSIISQIETNRNLINELLDIEEGNWLIQNNQMIFYKRNGDELMRFNLFDSSGNPSESEVYRRDKV